MSYPLIQYIEKFESQHGPAHTRALKWTLRKGTFGCWTVTRNDDDDFHFLVSSAYWWSMGERHWWVRLWWKVQRFFRGDRTDKETPLGGD